MIQQIFQTDVTIASATMLRVVLGLVMLPHGAQKLLGWFGGFGYQGTMHFFTNTIGLPWVIGFAVIMVEFFGSMLLLLGLATRPVAAIFIVLICGIMYTSHLSHGFFMNWMGNKAGEGYEYFLLMLGMSAALLISGGGRWSADSLFQAV